MIQKLMGALRDELQIIYRLHHQPSVDNETIFFWYTKCST